MGSLRVAGKSDREHLAAVTCGLSPDASAQDLHEVLGNCKPQAESSCLARTRTIHLVETLEHPAPVFRRDSGAMIPNADADLVACDLSMDVDRGARRRELGRVIEQVVERL